MPWSVAASSALRTSTSHTASWNDAATSATGTGSPERSRASTQRATAVLRPENEKSKRCRSRSRREVSPRGKSMATLLPDARLAVDVRATGERQPEQPGHLVERLPRRVVDGRAQRRHAGGHVLDPQQAGVAAADQHRQHRLRQRTVLELVDGDVRGEVVDAVERLAEPDRERLGGRDTDEQRAGQAGSAGDGDRVDVVRRDAGRLAGPLDGRDHRLEVRPAGDLGHDAAEPGVLVDAARDRVGQQRVAADDPDAGLVAGGLDAEDERFVSHGPILPAALARAGAAARRRWRRPGSTSAAGRPRRTRGRRRTPARRRCPRAPRAASGRRRRRRGQRDGGVEQGGGHAGTPRGRRDRDPLELGDVAGQAGDGMADDARRPPRRRGSGSSAGGRPALREQVLRPGVGAEVVGLERDDGVRGRPGSAARTVLTRPRFGALGTAASGRRR